MLPTNDKAKKTFMKSDTIIFFEACEKLKMSQSQLATELGYSTTSPSGWIKKGEMPRVAAMAIEGLLRRRGDNGHAVGEHYIVIHVVDQRIIGSRMVTKINKANIGNQSYLLIPEV